MVFLAETDNGINLKLVISETELLDSNIMMSQEKANMIAKLNQNNNISSKILIASLIVEELEV